MKIEMDGLVGLCSKVGQKLDEFDLEFQQEKEESDFDVKKTDEC